MSNTELEFTDRYKALGIPYPDPLTMCDGDCEGTGWVPVRSADTDPLYHALWLHAHRKCEVGLLGRVGRFVRDIRRVFRYGLRSHWRVCFGKCDGWHFVRCPRCGGTGKKGEHDEKTV